MNYDFACLWVVNCETRKLKDSQASQYIAFFSSCKTCETRETRTDIFARSESYLAQNSREKYGETRLAVNPSHESTDFICIQYHKEISCTIAVIPQYTYLYGNVAALL